MALTLRPIVLVNLDLVDTVGCCASLRRFSPALVFSVLFAAVFASFRSRAALQVEVIALRHQLGVCIAR